MWQELNAVSENAAAQAESAREQHEFDAIVEQVCLDYDTHSGRRPTKFEINTLFRKRPDGNEVKASALNKAVALAVIASLRIRKHLQPSGKVEAVSIPDVVYTQAADHAKLDRRLNKLEKRWLEYWINSCDSAVSAVIKIQNQRRKQVAVRRVQDRREQKTAATKLQAIERGRSARKTAREQEEAALTIENAVRKRKAKQLAEVKRKEKEEKDAAMIKIQRQARRKLAEKEVEKVREEKVLDRTTWKKEDAQSHLEELKQVKMAVAGLQKAVESVQTHAVNELKKTVEGMNELRSTIDGGHSELPRYMRTTHTKNMKRDSKGGKRRIPKEAKPTPHKDPLVFGPPRPLPKRSKKKKKGNKQRNRRKGRGRNSPYLRGPRPQHRYRGFAESDGYENYVKVAYDLHGHRIAVPTGMNEAQFTMSLGPTIKGRPHYGVSEPIPPSPEFLQGMEGKGNPPWRSPGASVRPSPPTKGQALWGESVATRP